MKSVKDEFEIRVLEWALLEGRLQAGAEFPLLAPVARQHNAAVRKYYEFMKEVSPIKRANLTCGLIKNMWSRAASMVGDILSKDEKELYEQYRATNVDVPYEWYYLNNKVDKRRFTKVLASSLATMPGNKDEALSAKTTLYYVFDVNGWKINSVFDSGGRSALSYRHSISVQGCPSCPALAENIGAGTCLGLGSLTWQFIFEGELEQVTESVTDLCEVFLKAAPKWLDGLSAEEFVSQCRSHRS